MKPGAHPESAGTLPVIVCLVRILSNTYYDTISIVPSKIVYLLTDDDTRDHHRQRDHVPLGLGRHHSLECLQDLGVYSHLVAHWLMLE
jgi:hypothetical protein